MARKKSENRPDARAHLTRYLDFFVDPTPDEFQKNPLSVDTLTYLASSCTTRLTESRRAPAICGSNGAKNLSNSRLWT
jgi:hypothetical protein